MEVIEIQFEEMIRMGTLDEYLEECGYDLNEGIAISQSEMIGFEKLDMQVHQKQYENRWDEPGTIF